MRGACLVAGTLTTDGVGQAATGPVGAEVADEEL